MERSNWNVLTAGPSAGKSTTINTISYLGKRTTPEIARMVMDELISCGEDPDDYVGRQLFQDLLIEKQLEMEQRLPPDGELYMDRSVVDAMAYNEFFGLPVDEALYEHASDRYGTIYVLEQLPFDSDYARHEDSDDALEVHETIVDLYKRFGYDPVFVPLEPIADRVKLITGESPSIDSPIVEVYGE